MDVNSEITKRRARTSAQKLTYASQTCVNSERNLTLLEGEILLRC